LIFLSKKEYQIVRASLFNRAIRFAAVMVAIKNV